jgi:purine-nucleoside phosphorylase
LTQGKVSEAFRFPSELRGAAETAVVIGSGLSPDRWPGKVLAEVKYSGIEGMVVPSIEGHPGKLILLDTGGGKAAGDRLLVFAGRVHFYEGKGWDGAGGTVAAAASLGCRRVILTQAAGSLKRSLPVGSWMLPTGIVALPWSIPRERSPANPVISPRLRAKVSSAAAEIGLEIAEGILYWTAGPLYETPAEAEAAVLMGADAATMSPLPELAAAAAKGLEAVCLSYMTNFAPNVTIGATSHMEVLDAGRKGSETLSHLLPYLAKV